MAPSSQPARISWVWALLPSAALFILAIAISLLTLNSPAQNIPASTGMPTPGPQATPTQIKIVYIVMPGDTLASIAEYFDVSPEAVMQANHLNSPDEIYFGQSLVIPLPASTLTPPP